MNIRPGTLTRTAAVVAGIIAGRPFAAAAEESSGAAPVVPPVAPAVAPAAVSDTAEAAAALPGMAFSWSNYFEAIGILFVMLALLWGVLWFVRRRGNAGGFGGGATGLRIESRVALGPKKWILTAKCRNRYLIIGVTEQQITLIADYPADEGENREQETRGGRARPAAEVSDFSAVLRRNTDAAAGRAED